MSAVRAGDASPTFRPPLPNIAGAKWLTTPALGRIFTALEAGGGHARVVGGAVRDALLNRTVAEIDIATTVLPDDILRLASVAGLKAVATGIEHGTVTVIADHTPYEVTTLRRDVETDGRRAVVAFTTDWREDALRRDFTMNALYASRDGTLHDPICGYDDLRRRRVRFIGDATTRIREDYLRILRFFRFHAEIGHGEPDRDGLDATVALRDGLAGLSRERVRNELLRLLAAPGAVAAVRVMAENGIVDAIGFNRPDVGRLERLAALEAVLGEAGDSLLRLAALALVHDDDGSADALAERLRLANDERDRLAAMAGWESASPSLSGRQRHELIYRAGPRGARDRVLIAWAASGAAPDAPAWRELFEATGSWRPPVFPLKGRDLIAIGMEHGPRLGKLLGRLEREWIARDFEPGRDELLEIARRIGPGEGKREVR